MNVMWANSAATVDTITGIMPAIARSRGRMALRLLSASVGRLGVMGCVRLCGAGRTAICSELGFVDVFGSHDQHPDDLVSSVVGDSADEIAGFKREGSLDDDV